MHNPFASFSPVLHVTDVTAVAAALISAMSAFPESPSRPLPVIALRAISGIVDFVDVGMAKQPTSPLSCSAGSQLDSMGFSSSLSWTIAGGCGGCGDSLGQFDDALADFYSAYAEGISEFLFLPLKSQAGWWASHGQSPSVCVSAAARC